MVLRYWVPPNVPFSVERFYRCIPLKAKNEVGNHPSHDATLTADLNVPKLYYIAVSFSKVVWCDAFGYLGKGGQSFELSILFSYFARHSFHRIWKFLIGKMIIRIIWIPRCLCVCIIPRAAINSWECLLFALQLFQRKRPEQSPCLLFIDVIIYFNFVMSLLSNCVMMNLKLQNACYHWVYQFCLLLRRCREPKEISTLDKMLLGYGQLGIEPLWWRCNHLSH